MTGPGTAGSGAAGSGAAGSGVVGYAAAAGDAIRAATVVLVRGGAGGLEVLLTHRPATMAFAPDVHVFPGGRVDAADVDARLVDRSVVDAAALAVALGGDLSPDEAIAAAIAAIREAFEEVGILLADHAPDADLAAARVQLLAEPAAFPALVEALDARLRTDLLVPLSRWVTPPTLARRFDARFFAAALPNDAVASLLGDEVVGHGWHRPGDALESMAAGTLAMWLPTSTTLMQLEHAGSMDDIRERCTPGALGEIVVDDMADAIVRIEMPAGGGVAGQPVESYLVGRARCVLIDPGDPTGPALDRAIEMAQARGGKIVAIALTHVDPDHAAGAEAVREMLGVEVVVGPGGGRHLPYQTVEVEDGSIIDVGDVPLAVVATPGPRVDHLAFVIGEGQYAVTGDLDGVRGARSIVGPVDDAAWTRSVARLRSVAPDATWLPGHPQPRLAR